MPIHPLISIAPDPGKEGWFPKSTGSKKFDLLTSDVHHIYKCLDSTTVGTQGWSISTDRTEEQSQNRMERPFSCGKKNETNLKQVERCKRATRDRDQPFDEHKGRKDRWYVNGCKMKTREVV